MSEFDNYKPNSNKSKAESATTAVKESEKRTAKVVTNPVKVQKNELRKVADALVPCLLSITTSIPPLTY